MQQQEVPGKPLQEESDISNWSPPRPPRIGVRARSVLFFERYGFGMTCALVVIVIAYLYINADHLSQEEEEAVSEAAEHTAGALSVSAEVVDTSATLSLSIATNPAGASIFIDNVFVGISPLRGIPAVEGRHRVTVQKPDYTSLDTVLAFKDTGMSLQIKLREGSNPSLAVAGQAVSSAAPIVSDEPGRGETPGPPASPDVHPASPPEAEVVRKQPAHVAAERLTEATPIDAEETSNTVPEKETVAEQVKESAEEPILQVGEVQINSEPAGASVSVDGIVVGVTPLLLPEVEAGSQAITLRLEGYEAFTTTAAVAAQQRQTVHGTLEPLRGTLKILVKPWGTIYIDGTLHKSESDIWYTTKLTPGFHRVRVEHTTLGRWEQVVDVSAGKELPVTIDFNEDASDSQ